MSREISWKLGLGIVVLFWLLVSLYDFPAPFIDDGWYIGASINLVKHGVFSNPLCESLTIIGSGGHFYASMPFHNYVLAGWLWLFGISTLSFHAFYTGLAFMVALLVYLWLPVTRFATLAAVLVCLATYGLLGGTGYRPDSLGLVFVLLSLGLWRTESVTASFLANLCSGLAIITLPTVAIIGVLTSLAVPLYRALFQRCSLRALLPYLACTVAAYLLAFLIFLACIQGNLSSFLACLHANARLTQVAIADRFHLFTPLGVCKWLVLEPIFLVLLLVQLKSAFQRSQFSLLFVVGYILVAYGWLGYASFHSSTAGHIWGYACLMGILFIILWKNWRWPAWVALALIYPVAAFGHAHVAMQQLLADSPPSQAQIQSLRARVDGLHPRRLYLDEYAMRELYAYNLPDYASDYEWCSTTGWSAPRSEADMPKDAVFVTSVANAKPTMLNPDAAMSRQPLRIFGVAVPGVIKNPYQLEVYQTSP